MSLLHAHKNHIRAALLILFFLAIVGPWTYTSDGVPPWCGEGYVLIAEDRCVDLVSGITILAWLPMMAASVVMELLRQGPSILARALLVVALFAMMILPLASSLLLLLRGESPRRQRLHLAVLLFALPTGGLLPFFMTRMDRIVTYSHFWGIWLFVAVLALALAFELLIRRRRPPFRSQQLAPPKPAA